MTGLRRSRRPSSIFPQPWKCGPTWRRGLTQQVIAIWPPSVDSITGVLQFFAVPPSGRWSNHSTPPTVNSSIPVFGPIRISKLLRHFRVLPLCVISLAHSKVHNGHKAGTADRNTCWRDAPFELQQDVCIWACLARGRQARFPKGRRLRRGRPFRAEALPPSRAGLRPLALPFALFAVAIRNVRCTSISLKNAVFGRAR